MGRDHLAACIIRIAEPAKRLCLKDGRFRGSRIVQRQFVLLTTTVEVAQGKEDIAAKMMQLGEFQRHFGLVGSRFRLVEDVEGVLVTVDHPHCGGKTEPRAKSVGFVGGQGQRFLIDAD